VTTNVYVPGRCPLCGVVNECGLAAGASTCWCFSETITADATARVPAAARDAACLCRTCAAAGEAATALTRSGDDE
jgi:hypothetical protein